MQVWTVHCFENKLVAVRCKQQRCCLDSEVWLRRITLHISPRSNSVDLLFVPVTAPQRDYVVIFSRYFGAFCGVLALSWITASLQFRWLAQPLPHGLFVGEILVLLLFRGWLTKHANHGCARMLYKGGRFAKFFSPLLRYQASPQPFLATLLAWHPITQKICKTLNLFSLQAGRLFQISISFYELSFMDF